MKTAKLFKRAFSLFLTVLTVCTVMMPCALADTSYTDVSGYVKPAWAESVETSESYSWTYSDGIFCSGNANVSDTVSVLKISVVGNGSLSFRYKVSAPELGKKSTPNHLEEEPDSLVFWKNNPENVDKDFDEMISCEKRVYGEKDWQDGVMAVTGAEDGQQTDFYFMYKKNGSVHGVSDCAWVKDIVFSSGVFTVAPISSNESWGTVSTSYNQRAAGQNVTVTAQAAAGCDFYAWVQNGSIISTEAAYTFAVSGDASPMAVFGNADTVAQNIKTGLVYNSLADAMTAANSGDTVMLLRDCSVGTDVTVPEGVKLYVPYSAEYDADGCMDGTSADSQKLAASTKAFRTLTVADGGSIEVKGTLCVGGVIGYPRQPAYQGHTSGAYGRIDNKGSITVADGGVLDCWGFIDGNGKVEAESGAEIFEPFIVYDFAGGQNTTGLYSAGQSPFTQYTMQNISCGLDIAYGATLMGRCNLYASSAYNKTDAVIVGEGGLTSLASGAVLHRTVDKTVTCGSYCADLGKVTYSFDGGASFNCLSMKVLGVDISTKDIFFPIPYGYDYLLTNGTYEIATDIILMPGAEITVGEDATLCVNDNFAVLDGLKQKDLSGKYYPSTAMLRDAGYPTNAVLTVNGTVNVADGVMFVGTVQTRNAGAKLITGAGCDLEENIVLGATTFYGDNTTVLPLKAQVMMNGTLTQLECGTTYTATDAAAWTLSGYSANDGDGMGTVTTNQTAYGSFAHKHVFDRKNTDAKYLASAASCTAKATYYYSCACGEKGTQTFEYGNKLPHVYDQKNTDARYLAEKATCQHAARYYYSCTCGEKGTQTFEYGAKAAHEYSNGKCVHCGAADPSADDDSGRSQGFFSRLLSILRNILSKIFPFC